MPPLRTVRRSASAAGRALFGAVYLPRTSHPPGRNALADHRNTRVEDAPRQERGRHPCQGPYVSRLARVLSRRQEGHRAGTRSSPRGRRFKGGARLISSPTMPMTCGWIRCSRRAAQGHPAAPERLQGGWRPAPDRRLGLVRARAERPDADLRLPQHRGPRDRARSFGPFGELTMLIMGSGFEVLFPFAVGRCSSSASVTSCPRRSVGAGRRAPSPAPRPTSRMRMTDDSPSWRDRADAAGDWERILGVEFFDKVYLADSIAGTVRTVGYALWVVALGLAIWAIVRNRYEETAEHARPRPSAKPRSPPPRSGRRPDVAVAGSQPVRSRVGVRCSGVGPEGAHHGWKHRHDRMAAEGAAVLSVLGP